MKKKLFMLISFLLIFILCLNLVGCGNIKSQNLMKDITAQKTKPITEFQNGNIAAINFAVRLFKECEQSGKNTLISPLSVMYSLAMTANGADSDTLAEMENVLGMPINDLNRYLYSYKKSLPQGEKYKLNLANSIWFSKAKDFKANQVFLQTNANYYDANIYEADFSKKSTLNDINKWASLKTEKMIPEIVEKIEDDDVMFLINALATVVAMVFIIGVYVWMRRRRLKTTFGDVTSGVLLQVIRYALLRLDAKSNDAKSWRPNILVFSGIPTKRWHLIDFAYGIAQEKGLITVATILPEKGVTQERVTKHAHNIASYLREKNIKTLIRVTRAEDPFVGSKQLVNSYGLGSLVPNTVLLGDTEENSHHSAYCEMISHFYQSKRNVIILQNDFKLDYIGTKQIDLWWGGLKGNGGLMMIIAHLIKTSPRWRRISVCVKMVVATEEAAKGTRENLKSILHEMRVDFNSEIIVSAGRPFWDILQQESQDSTMVMMGLKTPDDDFANYYKQLKVNTQAIKNKVFFLASEHIEFEDVLN